MITLLALLAACSSSPLPAQSAPPLFEATALLPGEQLTLSVSGVPSGARVYFLVSTAGEGSGPCPGPLRGECLDILSPFQVLGNRTAAGGTASLTLPVPGNLAVDEAWFQAVALGGGQAHPLNVVHRVTWDEDFDGIPDNVDTDTDILVHTDTDFSDDTDVDTEVPVDTDPPPWSHTIVVDGDISDWLPGEQFQSSDGPGRENYISWDADNLYVGATHPDVTTGGPEHWLVITLGDGSATGGLVGAQIGGQEPGLALPASHVLRWKADDSYTDLLTWDINRLQWNSDADWVTTTGGQKQESNANGAVELAIPRAALGVTNAAMVHVSWVFEGAGNETTYGGSPSNSFPNGVFDPDYAAFYVFGLDLPSAPGAYPPTN